MINQKRLRCILKVPSRKDRIFNPFRFIKGSDSQYFRLHLDTLTSLVQSEVVRVVSPSTTQITETIPIKTYKTDNVLIYVVTFGTLQP